MVEQYPLLPDGGVLYSPHPMADHLSPSEVAFVLDSIAQGIRLDGRSHMDFRQITVQRNVAPTCMGSSRIVLGATEVMIGIKAECACHFSVFRACLLIEMSALTCCSDASEGTYS
jgi:hypothetical protein